MKNRTFRCPDLNAIQHFQTETTHLRISQGGCHEGCNRFRCRRYVDEGVYQGEVVDYSETPAADFVDSATAVAKDLLEHKDSQGFAFDKYGVGSYMAAVKIKGMVVANISDERSAYMTREHNGSRMVTMGPGVVGTEVAKKIAREFLRAQYAGGRHQIRVDMLNKMA